MPDATERKALILCTFASGCIALAPVEWVSGVALVLLSGLFALAHRSISRREGAFLALLDAWEPLAVEGPQVALGVGDAAGARSVERADEAKSAGEADTARGAEEANAPEASPSRGDASGESEPSSERASP